jgi:hypothetical protein
LIKKDKAYRKKWILMLSALIIMSIPMIQHSSSFFNEWELKGDIKEVPSVSFTVPNWFSGKHAKETDLYMTNNFGLRTYAVRADNQMAYSLFGEIRAKQVVIGKDQYLYEDTYIDAYTGLNFLGEKVIQEKVRQFKFIQDSLQVRGKHLLIILAAGKASFYPEYIPEELMIETDSTNYHFYARELKKQGIQHIDFNRWFMDNKGKMRYPLYPKTGIHWSEYGMGLAADSIINKVAELGNWNLPKLYWENVDYVDERREIDNDIEVALNIIEEFPNFNMAYPHFEFETKGKDSTNVIMISDSFFWRMFNLGVMPRAFPNGQFWYYNNKSYPQHFKNTTLVSELDLEEEIKKVDVVIMMASETNLHKFPWDADQQFSNYFKGKYTFNHSAAFKRKVNRIQKKMRSDKKWLGHIQEKADKIGISLDSMVYLDAVYMLEN